MVDIVCTARTCSVIGIGQRKKEEDIYVILNDRII